VSARPPWWWPTHAAGATLLYTALTVAYTWPLSMGLSADVPWDLGDSLLNCWILGWHYHQAGTLLAGDWTALATWWHPGIFHPHPYAFGYSELLVTQAVMGAPVYALTGNIILTYNLLFLSSFVLSALGAFLLVRRVTGDAHAAWVAGLLYGFALYRVTQAPHLQVLSAQWAPFVLWFLHRWFDHGRWSDAALAGLALAAQNLANGYYLFYLALLLPPYVLAQLVARRALRSWRVWCGPVVAALVAAALTIPLLYPYLQLRRLGQSARPMAAVAMYGADTQAWLTANDQLRIWGWLRTFPRPEGDLFPGVTSLALAALGLGLTLHTRSRRHVARALQERSREDTAARHVTRWSRTRSLVATVAGASLAWHSVAIVLSLFGGFRRIGLGPVTVSMTDPTRLLALWAVSLGLLVALSPRARHALVDRPHAPVVILGVLMVLTVWLSFGPYVRLAGRDTGLPGIYQLLYDGVPGANALRVPPRIAMMTALFLAMLGGIGVAAMRPLRWLRGPGTAALSVVIVVEAWAAPIPRNLAIDVASGLVPVPTRAPAFPGAEPDVQMLRSLPADAVLVELPFGSMPYEIRWQYLAIGHWRARVNGYSGGFPDPYLRTDHILSSLPGRQDEATSLLDELGVTHVVLHPAAWTETATVESVRAWLRSAGASRLPATPTLEVWQWRGRTYSGD
jgi:hypothetical protein